MATYPCSSAEFGLKHLDFRYPTRNEVTNANDSRLRQLPGEPSIYEARDQPGVDDTGQRISHERMLQLLDRLVAPRKLELKVGAQVMLIKVPRYPTLI